MTALRPGTRDFDQSARDRLGRAVLRAREAAGFLYRPAFAEVAKVGITSLVKLETGKPVGPKVYEAVARALPGWREDTPLEILQGGAIPEDYSPNPKSNRAETPGPSVDPTSSIGLPIGSDAWLRHYAERVPEEDFLEIRAAVLRLQRKLAEVQHLVAERDQPHMSQ